MRIQNHLLPNLIEERRKQVTISFEALRTRLKKRKR